MQHAIRTDRVIRRSIMRGGALGHVLFIIGLGATAQTLVSTGGGTGTVPGGSVSWSVGEPIIGSGTVPGGLVTQGYQQPTPLKLRLNMRAFLQGPYGNGAMNDDLRAAGLLPLTEPYTALGYTFEGGGGESTAQFIIDFPGTHAIIDWVVVELRDKNDNTNVLFSRAALLQADGDIVEVDGHSPVRCAMGPDHYYIALRHRNHLAVMTLDAIPLGSTVLSVDLTDGSRSTFGSEAQQVLAGTYVLWAGDVTFDGTIKYTGQSNDRDPILSAIGGAVPTSTITGYHASDVNMDGTVKYTGTMNDRDIILQNIGGVVPTNIRVEQIP